MRPATSPDRDQLIVRMLSTIGRLLDARWLAFWLVDEARDSLRMQATVRDGRAIAADLEHPFIKDPSLWKTDPGVQELFFTGTPMICEDIAKAWTLSGSAMSDRQTPNKASENTRQTNT